MSQILIFRSERVVRVTHNKSLQRTFDTPPFLLRKKQASPQTPLNSGVRPIEEVE